MNVATLLWRWYYSINETNKIRVVNGNINLMFPAMKIQISEDVKRALDKTGLFITSPRGMIEVKVIKFCKGGSNLPSHLPNKLCS